MNFFTKLFSSRSKALQKAQVLLEVQSPTCPITAIVEQDKRVAYFYLYGPEHLKYGIKSCWIRNLKKAPIKLETQLMNKGIPPMLPKAFCKFPEGQNRRNLTFPIRQLTKQRIQTNDAETTLEF